ncbi:MAG: hypothetical protein PHC85_00470 [Candidatus Pacebacteria bacterium]|nr:hypothetical protein [Candidatus Paceibacterota bacterium]
MSGNGTPIAVFDIASASVGGLLFRVKKDCGVEILTSVRLPVNFSKDEKRTRLWQNLKDGVKAVSEQLKKSPFPKPEAALCVFSSPWYAGQTKIIKVKREIPFKIDEKLLESLTKDEMGIFEKSWADTKDGNAQFLEHTPTKAVLNGYDIKDIFGKTAKAAELHLYLSIIPGELENKIKKEILNDLKPDSIKLHSFAFAFFKVMENLIDMEKGAMFVDITGDITDVIVFREHSIEEICSFPKGEKFFARRIASALNLDETDASNRLIQYQRGELDQYYGQKIKLVLESAAEEWGKSMESLFEEMSKDRLLPQNLYFCGQAVSFPEITAQFSKRNFARFTNLGMPFETQYLLPESLKYHFDFPQGFSGNKDIFLLLEALFASTFVF